MLKLRPNPFRPDKPITDFDLFAGRLNELTTLVEALYQAGYGNPRHMIITGPRGIGKSSFVNQLQPIADDSKLVLNKLKIESVDFKFNFAIFKHRAVEGESVGQVVSSLLSKMPTKISRDNALSLVKDFVEKWKPSVSVGGMVELEYQADIVSNLSSDFVKTVNNLCYAWSIADDLCYIDENDDKNQEKPIIIGRNKLERDKVFQVDISHTTFVDIVKSVGYLYPSRCTELASLGKIFSAACLVLISWAFKKGDPDIDFEREAIENSIKFLISEEWLYSMQNLRCDYMAKFSCEQVRYNGYLNKYAAKAVTVLKNSLERVNLDDKRTMNTIRDDLMYELFQQFWTGTR